MECLCLESFVASIYNLLILIGPDSDFSFLTAAKCLVEAPGLLGVRVEQPSADRLNLLFDSWRLIICLEDFPWVEEESREMSECIPISRRPMWSPSASVGCRFGVKIQILIWTILTTR